MIDKAAGKLKSDGWKVVDTTGFLHLIGPLWQRLVDGQYEFALITEDKHHNRRGLVQGGVLMTFADRTCGITAPRLRGEVGLPRRCEASSGAIRVRGTIREREFVESRPHPNPLPAKGGAR